MTSYCNIDNAYNNANEELDKMARRVNNDKKSLVKSTQQKYNSDVKAWGAGVNQLMGNPEFSFFSAQGENYQINPEHYKGSLINTIASDESSQFSDDSVYDGIYGSLDSQTIDSYLDVAKSDKYGNTNNKLHKMIKSIHNGGCNDNSDESTFDHIKHCKSCKEKLLTLINKSKHIKTIDILPPKKNSSKGEKNESMFGLGTLQTKEILMIVLIGIFIIILLDVFIRTSRK